MSDKPTIIYEAANPQQAVLLKNFLETQGIQAEVSNISLQAAAGELPLGSATAPRVLVPPQDAETARALVLEFEQRAAANLEGWSDSEQETEAQPWDQWPSCPQCGQRRQTLCPVCETAGNEFPLADWVPASGPAPGTQDAAGGSEAASEQEQEPILLLCLECDEPFTPRFYRRCHQCGHDFGEGIERSAAESSTDMELTGRTMGVLLGLVAVGGGLLLYFWFLFR